MQLTSATNAATPTSPRENGATNNSRCYEEFVSFLSNQGNIEEDQIERPAAGVANPTGRCPFLHGTVYAGPYPGYVHGNRAICPNGCRAQLNSEITKSETPKETLLREAMEYLELYYSERTDEMERKSIAGFVSKEERMAMVKTSIQETGTYEHTFDELEHGARVAWRNAPKCSNRKYWQQLKLLDARDVSSNEGMYSACMAHLAKAMACGSSEAYVTVFRPVTPGKDDGPQIWNDQLLSYAAYRKPISIDAFAERRHSFVGEEILGDPKNLGFTQMLEKRFGWRGPSDGVKGAHDYLPLVCQVNPHEPTEIFEVPLEVAPPIHITHHQYPGLSSLGMRWYPIPAVSALDMVIGGLTYSACPFNGWYANTEVVRDLTDESRYNLLVPIGKALGLNVNVSPGDAPLWIDQAMSILSLAVYKSFKNAKTAMIDHHTLINSFYSWYKTEMKERKYCPVNWKWVIPPMSPSTSPAYLKLNKAVEFTLKPAYVVGKSFKQLEIRHFGPSDPSKVFNDFVVRTILLIVGFNRMIARFRSRKQSVLIVYASVTGNASKWADELGSILRSAANVHFVDACRAKINSPEGAEVLAKIQSSTLTVFVSSTQGNGELPGECRQFFSSLFDANGYIFAKKQCAVLGFGSSAYPIFCGAAVHLSNKLAYNNAEEIVTRGQCDAVKGEASTFYSWTATLVAKLASMTNASPYMSQLLDNMHGNTLSGLRKRKELMDSVTVQVFTPDQVHQAAGTSFLRRSSISANVLGSSRRNSRVSLANAPDESLDLSPSSIENIVSRAQKSSLANPCFDPDVYCGVVTNREDLIGSNGGRKTSFIKIDISAAGSPHYQPGDHVRVFPRNVIPEEQLQEFVHHLSGDHVFDDYIYVSLENERTPTSELAISLPLVHKCLSQLISLQYFFEKVAAILAPISNEALHELAELTSNDADRALLNGLTEIESKGELRWIDLFETTPSLSKKVSIEFLLSNMKINHPRSYSISSCGETVGSELHLCVGRFLYNVFGEEQKVGICSDFLTSVEEGDEVLFKLESSPRFHYPPDRTAPLIMICTGTGYAPIRGLLQKREHLKSSHENLGPAYLIFGTRCAEEGLFRGEIEMLVQKKVIGKVYMSYSREPGQKKEYTSDKIRNDRVREVLARVLKTHTTHIYICGSANMAEQSKESLAYISSKETMELIEAEGRLHQDVFGALTSSSSAKTDVQLQGALRFDELEAVEKMN